MSELLAPEACPFCGAEPRTDWGFKCGSGPVGGWNSRSVRCREAEVAKLAAERDQLIARVKRLEEAGGELDILLRCESGIEDTEEWACATREMQLAMIAKAQRDWLKAKEAKP